MFDKTEAKVIKWMIDTNYLPIVRTAIFMAIEADLEQVKDMQEPFLKKELLHRVDHKHKKQKQNVIAEIIRQYDLGTNNEERLYFFDRLCEIYDLILSKARTIVDSENYQSISALCAK